MQLFIDRFGAFLGKKSQRLQIEVDGEVVEEYPFMHLDGLIISSKGVSFSTDLISSLTEKGIMTYITNYSGKPVALISSPALHATVKTRRRQLLTYYEPLSTSISKAIVSGKLTNQEYLLKYYSKYRKGDTKKNLIELAQKISSKREEVMNIPEKPIDDTRETFLNIEAVAGKYYWTGINILLKERFNKREHRGADDPVNSCLNYGYGILYGKIWQAIILAGLEPFAGFLHTDRPGRPSLVLDLIEEFRQFSVDRPIIAIFSRKRKIEMNSRGLLNKESRKLVADEVIERLETPANFKGKKHTLSSIIQMQARNLATAIRENCEYKPFRGKW